MRRVSKDRRSRRVLRFGGGGEGGVAFVEVFTVLPGGFVGGMGLAPLDAGGIDVAGGVWEFTSDGEGGASGTF